MGSYIYSITGEMVAANEGRMMLLRFEHCLTRRTWLAQGSLEPGALIATHQKEL
jgi:hypothetical protein